MKRAAVILFGIHFQEEFKHWMGHPTSIDFRKSVENYRQQIFAHLKDYEVDVFFSTYGSSLLPELIAAYSPKGCTISEMVNDGKNQVQRRNRRFIEAVELARSYSSDRGFDYDLAVITRFDLKYLRSLGTLKIEPGKLNVSYQSKWGPNADYVDDNLYVVTQGGLSRLSELANRVPLKVCYHELHKHCGDFEVNRIIDGEYYSHESPLYTFVR